ncbi:MAG TPA: amidohydrolase/deacetylase family metallohydrolase [Hanamia sp.]|nr:amidohydrolase/deacetylase family metallohydrolase [Hanamia sp.]
MSINYLSTKRGVKEVILYSTFTVALNLFVFFVPAITQAQQFDLLIKNGHVIDPKNRIDSKMDVAVKDGKIAEVSKDIPYSQSKKVVDANGYYVTPGLIDIHTHVFVGPTAGFANGSSSVKPDDFTLRSGVTTVVDAGTSGWRNFATFKEQVIDRSKTRVLVFLNAFGEGMIQGPGSENVDDMSSQMASAMIKRYSDIIVGICIGHYDGGKWAPFERAEEIASMSNVPLFVECHLKNLSLEGQLSRMKSGDILTHCFEKVEERTPVVDERTGKIQSYVLEAKNRGILFDLGHGGAGFWFSQAIPAIKDGFWPDSFGSDMHHNSVNGAMQDMLNSMSKFLNMGMALEDVVLRGSWNPAVSIKRNDLGNLSKGAVADIAILGIRKGNFGFMDCGDYKIMGTQKFEGEMTIRGGKIVWDRNGLAAKEYKNLGNY